MTGKSGKKWGKRSGGKSSDMEKRCGGNKKQFFKTEEGLPLLRTILKEAGFKPKEPKPQTAWEAFRRFSSVQFKCAGDSLLFEAGMFDFMDDEQQFCLSFVRQFTVEVEDEYDYIEQIHLDLFYQPADALKNLEETIWTCDFDDAFPPFFEAVERSDVFLRVMSEYQPISCEIYQDEV